MCVRQQSVFVSQGHSLGLSHVDAGGKHGRVA